MSTTSKEIARDALDRLCLVVEEEELAHRQLAEFVEELIGQLKSPLTNEQMMRYIETMQSFDRMRQRVGYLSDVTAAAIDVDLNENPELDGLVNKSPSPEDGEWLAARIVPGEESL